MFGIGMPELLILMAMPTNVGRLKKGEENENRK